MITNTAGPPVQGDNFFDREREQELIWTRLATDNVLLLAPRRVGKTSLLFRLNDTAELEQFQAVYLTVSDKSTELAFVEALYSAVAEHSIGKRVINRLSKGPMGRWLRRAKKLQVMGTGIEFSDEAVDAWARLAQSLTAALSELDGRWLIMVDELPLFVMALIRADASHARARTFLNWFRTLRQGQDASANIRWLLCGSIGLDTVAARYGLGDTINDLYIADLGAFDEPTANRFLEILGEQYGLPLTRAVRMYLMDRVGWLTPYHLQLLFGALREQTVEPGAPPAIESVERAYEQLLSPTRKSYFDFWVQRLHSELEPPEDQNAIALLNAAAQDPAGFALDGFRQVLGEYVQDPRARDEQLRYLMDVLQGDGYLIEVAGRYSFRSPLLRDYWRRRVSG